MDNSQNTDFNKKIYFYPPSLGESAPLESQAVSRESLAKAMEYSALCKKEKSELLKTSFLISLMLFASLAIQFIGVYIINLFGKLSAYDTIFTYQHATNIILVDFASLLIPFALGFAILKKNFVTPLIPRKKVGFIKGSAWVFLGIGICILANFVTNFVVLIAEKIGYELSVPDTLKPTNVFEYILLIVSTAVIPAICEEFAFRCSALGALRKYGKGFAVTAIALAFGMFHGNIIQFVFAFSIALMMGYVTVKTDNVFPAMFIHGLNNGLSVVQDITKDAFGKKISDDVVEGLFIAYGVLAVISLIYLLKKREIRFRKPKDDGEEAKPVSLLSTTEKVLCSLPIFIVPLIILISGSMSTITKI